MCIRDRWKKSGNNWYWLNSDGEMAIDQLIEDGDNYYYVDINGVMAVSYTHLKAGKIEYRLDKTNIIHVPVGKASFTEEQLADNFQTLIDTIIKARPSTLKGTFLKSVTLTSTMGPGVKLNVAKLGN